METMTSYELKELHETLQGTDIEDTEFLVNCGFCLVVNDGEIIRVEKEEKHE